MIFNIIFVAISRSSFNEPQENIQVEQFTAYSAPIFLFR